MSEAGSLWLGAMFFIIAMVYAAVGQAGASGYLAAMGFFGAAPLAMKTTALALNLLVAAIGTYHFHRASHLSWQNVHPFALLGFPFSILGGAIQLPGEFYYPAVGMVLILSSILMARSAPRRVSCTSETPVAPPFWAGLLTGAVIGFISGTTGTGGGVFLAPVILVMNWGTSRQTAATTAVYNLMNSAAALLGAAAYWNHLPTSLSWWLAAVAAGGSLGAFIGSRHLSERWLRFVLALLLLASGAKLLWQ